MSGKVRLELVTGLLNIQAEIHQAGQGGLGLKQGGFRKIRSRRLTL